MTYLCLKVIVEDLSFCWIVLSTWCFFWFRCFICNIGIGNLRNWAIHSSKRYNWCWVLSFGHNRLILNEYEQSIPQSQKMHNEIRTNRNLKISSIPREKANLRISPATSCSDGAYTSALSKTTVTSWSARDFGWGTQEANSPTSWSFKHPWNSAIDSWIKS